jgi:predicted metal-dependent enzyme (double-stranded beta helix superfamily)
MSLRDTNTPESFVEEASALVRRQGPNKGAFDTIAEGLRRLASQPGVVSDERLRDLHGATASATILAEAQDGSALMLARFPPDAPTPVHNHDSWAVICVVKGRDHHVKWERMDEGSVEGRAEIRIVEERDLGPGDVTFLDEPPGDIHSQQGVGGDAYELVFFGSNPLPKTRTYFDPDAGTITYSSST